MNTPDHWLDKAAHYESKFVEGDESARKKANMAFRRAMHLDGNEDYKDDII